MAESMTRQEIIDAFKEASEYFGVIPIIKLWGVIFNTITSNISEFESLDSRIAELEEGRMPNPSADVAPADKEGEIQDVLKLVSVNTSIFGNGNAMIEHGQGCVFINRVDFKAIGNWFLAHAKGE